MMMIMIFFLVHSRVVFIPLLNIGILFLPAYNNEDDNDDDDAEADERNLKMILQVGVNEN